VLKTYGEWSVRRVELVGWTGDMEEVKRLVECVPGLTWLDLGRRAGGTGSGAAMDVRGDAQGFSRMRADAHANITEWSALLSALPHLTTFHGLSLFYAVASSSSFALSDPLNPLSTSERSRLRKNEEIASVLGWKCPRLRRVDHWEEGVGKVVVLLREGEKVRWEVRRVKV